jgi:hypothetical protein
MCKHYTYMFWPEPKGQPDNSEAEAARLFWLAKPWHCRSASAASRPAGRAVTVRPVYSLLLHDITIAIANDTEPETRTGRYSTAAAVLWARLILIGTARPDRHFQDSIYLYHVI